MFKKLFVLVMVLALSVSCISAFAWAPEWEHDEDLSAYKLCENFGDITLRVAVTDLAAIADWETNAFISWLEEVTNIDLTFELVPYESRQEKLGLLLASGNYPDMFWNVGMNNAQVSQFGVEEQMLLPLNDLIAEKSNFFNRAVDGYPGILGLVTQLDGNIYTMPSINECYHCSVPNKFWINQTWLDNLGLQMPTTLDELYDVLVAFRDQDANGNGDPTDEIPMAGDYFDGWNTNVERPIMNAFTYYNLDLDKTANSNEDAFGMYLDGETVVVPFELDEFKEGIKYVNKLVSEGLIYEGSFTQDLAGLTNICESGRLGCAPGGYILFATLGGDTYRQYAACMPLTGPDGRTGTLQSQPYAFVEQNFFAISADTPYAEECFMLNDLLYSQAATMRGYYGRYNSEWTDAEEGAVGINGLPALYKILVPWQESEPQDYCVLQMVPSFRDSDYRLGEPSDPSIDLYGSEGLETLLYQTSKLYKEYATDEKVVPPVKFTDEQNSDMAIIKANLSNTIKEGMFAFFNGTKSVDTDYDAWLADLEAQGIKDLIGYYQAAYDQQYLGK